MRLDHLVADTLSRLIGRLLRRAIAALLLGLFVLAVIYQLTVAGTLELANSYGLVNARLIVAGVYAAAAIGTLVFLFATRGKPVIAETEAGALGKPRDLRIAMLLESVLLGYSLARNRSRSS
jgi:hypothetical protein